MFAAEKFKKKPFFQKNLQKFAFFVRSRSCRVEKAGQAYYNDLAGVNSHKK